MVENRHERRADVVLFVNGLPLAVMELKNAADEKATIWAAFNQLQTYKQQIPALFTFNEALVISDGLHARIGTLTADRERFMPWRTIDGSGLADEHLSQLQVVIEGVFDRRRFLDLVRYFIVFEDVGNGVLIKKMAGYHQYHAVNAAVEETLRACAPAPDRLKLGEMRGVYRVRGADDGLPRKPGDRRIGVVWHTQGSGKSLTMAFYAGKIIQHPRMENPTVVVLTDRNDLDNQLFDNFALDKDLLRQAPAQAENRADLRGKAARGVRRRDLHHHPEILLRGQRRRRAGAVGAPQHRGHRRRGAAQPVRLHRRLRPAHARRAAQRLASSASPARPSSGPTPTPGRCSATTSASTTSGRP